MSLKERVLDGETLEDVEIIDAHMHLNEPPFYVPSPDWESCIKTMDKYGISRGISAPELGITCSMEEGNSEILEVSEQTDRLLPYCTINPHFPDRIGPELERCFARGAVGIKIHPAIHQVAITDERYYPVYEYASDTGKPVLSHTWGECPVSSPGLCVQVAERFPDIQFILGHTGGTFKGLQESIAAMKEKPANLTADITGSTQFLRRIEILCREVTAERVVFGSDSPWIEPGLPLGAIVFADITDEEKQLILSGNIKRLMDIGKK